MCLLMIQKKQSFLKNVAETLLATVKRSFFRGTSRKSSGWFAAAQVADNP